MLPPPGFVGSGPVGEADEEVETIGLDVLYLVVNSG
jgi:hypothetical protein